MAKKKSEDKLQQNGDNTSSEIENSSPDEEPNFSDPEGFVDNVTDEGRCHIFASILTFVIKT